LLPNRPVPGAPLIVAVALALAGLPVAPSVLASPDGADWQVVELPDGCRSCHLGEDAEQTRGTLEISGLPDSPLPGQAYPLTIAIEDPALRNAGFLLTVRSETAAAGSLTAADTAIETNGAQARSTWDSSFPPQPGRASWELIWTAPEVIDAVLKFDLWGNAGNDDLSPLGDRPQHRIWEIAPPRNGSPDPGIDTKL